MKMRLKKRRWLRNRDGAIYIPHGSMIRYPGVGSGGASPPSANLVQHLKADALSLSDGTAVETWTATVGRDATQSTPESRPTFETNEQNGLPCIRFDGSNDYMRTSAFASSQSQPFVIFLAFKSKETTTGRIIDGINSRGFHLRAWFDGDGDFLVYAGSSFVKVYDTASSDVTYLCSFEMNGASSKYRINGESEATFLSSPGTDALDGLTICVANDLSTEFSQVDMFEILIYSGTIADKSSHFSYLNTKWAAY
jgi:hypothetical protein